MSTKHVVVVLPTYNEKDNIVGLLEAIQRQKSRLNSIKLSVLVVDDSSPDGTGELVKKYAKRNSNVYLLSGKKEGLGAAYTRGFQYTLEKMDADVIFEMDADFSHDPNDIPRLLDEVLNGSDFVIGSRYILGGSVPENWSWLRKANSRWGNIFARHVAGLDDVKDCTSGYRAIRTELLKQVDLSELGVKGYAFQISLLHKVIKQGVVVSEIPIKFADRKRGRSKLRLNDVIEFVLSCFSLWFSVAGEHLYDTGLLLYRRELRK